MREQPIIACAVQALQPGEDHLLGKIGADDAKRLPPSQKHLDVGDDLRRKAGKGLPLAHLRGQAPRRFQRPKEPRLIVRPEQRLTVQIGEGRPKRKGAELYWIDRLIDEPQALTAIADYRDEQIGLIFEVVVRGAFAHAGALKDAVDRRVGEAEGGELLRGDLE